MSKHTGKRTELRRRDVLIGAGALGVAGGLGEVAAPSVARAQGGTPLRIGFLNTFSGQIALLGESNWNAMNLYLEQKNWQIAGRKVELIREDDTASPPVGLDKMKKLVESDRVDLVCGVQFSPTAVALMPYLRQSRAFFINSGAGVSLLSWERVPYMFRTSLSTWQVSTPVADWFYDNVAKENVVLTCSDFSGGRSIIGDFKSQFERRGGKVTAEIFPPLGTNDFSPYLTRLRSHNPSATYHFYAGTDAVRFVNQYATFGLKDKIPLVAGLGMVDTDTFPGQGRNALGIVSPNIYSNTLDTPGNKEFVENYRAKYKAVPNVYSCYGYTTARAIEEALKLTGGKSDDKDKLNEAMLRVKFDDIRGPVEFSPTTRDVIQNVYIMRCEEKEGAINNYAITTIKGVRVPDTKA